MARKLRDCERGYVGYSKRNPDSTVPHLIFLGEFTFCEQRIVAGAEGTKFEDVCPRCISTAKHMGLREH